MTTRDCERNAAKRLLLAINQLYANRSFIVLEDALAANGPHIQALMGYGMDFITNIKPVGNASLFEVMHERFLLNQVTEGEETLVDGSGRGYRFNTDFPMNASHPNTRANMIENWEGAYPDPFTPPCEAASGSGTGPDGATQERSNRYSKARPTQVVVQSSR